MKKGRYIIVMDIKEGKDGIEIKSNIITINDNPGLKESINNLLNTFKNVEPTTVAKKEKDTRIKELIDYYYDKFTKFYNGEKPHIDGGKDGHLIKLMLKHHSLEQLKYYMDVFFDPNIEDNFIDEAGRTIGVFKAVLNKIITFVVKEKIRNEKKIRRNNQF